MEGRKMDGRLLERIKLWFCLSFDSLSSGCEISDDLLARHFEYYVRDEEDDE